MMYFYLEGKCHVGYFKKTKDLPTKQFLNKLNTYQLYFINVSVQGSTSPLCTFVLRVE